MKEQYTYAVARVRAAENSLLSMKDLEQVLSAKDEKEAFLMLQDKGFSGSGSYKNVETLLFEENEKTINFISELKIDKKEFSIFYIQDDYHNLKAAIKCVHSGFRDKVFVPEKNVSLDVILTAVKERKFDILPENMQRVAEEALDVLLKTGDGQKADMIIDKAALLEIKALGEKSDNDLIKEYAKLFVSLSDIKIAARSAIMNKSYEFIKAAVIDTEDVNTDQLCRAASDGYDELLSYLSSTKFEKAADALRQSFSQFEKWCDNSVMSLIKTQKANPFTIGPVAAYFLARDIEIKAVRIVLSGVINKLDINSVKERLRDLYV